MSDKRLFLVDGNSLLYRAYYAIRQLSTSQGFPTNAIYGFLATLKKLKDREKPDYLGIVFDTGKPTIRHKAFKDYKANRKPMPEDLLAQVPVLKNVLRALNIPLFEQENYEADDVLGCLAAQAASQGMRSVIVTTDKDLLQLVNPKITVYNPAKEIYLDEDKVKEYFGVPPSQVVDVLSLWGDPSDNIPGVPGIGEKTSKNLIHQFGSLDKLLQNINLVKNPRIREKIEQNMGKLQLSRELVTIEKNLDLKLNLKEFEPSPPDSEEVTKLFRDLGFTSLLGDYIKEAHPQIKDYRVIYKEAELKEVVSQIQKAKSVSIDTETDSVSPTRAVLVGISLAVKPGQAFYLPLHHDYSGAPEQLSKESSFRLLKDVLANPRIKKTGQNIKYDFIVLRREGVRLEGIDMDTMVLSYLLEPNWGKHNLEKLALNYLQVQKVPYESVAGKGKNEKTMNQVEIERVAPYSCQDADLALELSRILWPKIEEKSLQWLYREIELPLIEVLAEMEMSGVRVDPTVLQDLSGEFEEQLGRLRQDIYRLAGHEFNINSPQQLAHVLFHKLNLPTSRKTRITRGFSTSLDILQELAPLHPLAQDALEYRQLAKLKSTYADALPLLLNPMTGKIHTSYNQTVTATGRLSSSDPNLQNIPVRGDLGQRFRQAFVPSEGNCLLSADYSQIELRVLAHLSRDPALMEIFLNDRDIHTETAARVFGEGTPLFREEQRRRAKVINFSIIYGTSAFSLAKELGTTTSEAQRFIDRYFEKYPQVKEFLESCVSDACNKGFSETLFGRQRQVPELRHSDKNIQQAGRRIALNTPIQGSAADLMKKAMIDISGELKAKGLQAKMILQVHDELVFDVPEAEKEGLGALVIDKMENVYPLAVPLKVHLGWGKNWAEAK
jgi:DNA polymerase-1